MLCTSNATAVVAPRLLVELGARTWDWRPRLSVVIAPRLGSVAPVSLRPLNLGWLRALIGGKLVEKTLESEVPQKQAENNSKEQFTHSPDLTREILSAVIDGMDAQAELRVRAINSAEIREGLKNVLIQLGLSERLRERARSAWQAATR